MSSFSQLFDAKYALHIPPELARAALYTIGITLIGFTIAGAGTAARNHAAQRVRARFQNHRVVR